jgi:UDP-glucose 4-epimerase
MIENGLTLITGAGGLIGRHLTAALAPRGPVVAVTRRPLDGGANVRNVVTDLATPQFVDALPDNVHAVVHLAQSAHYREFPQHADNVFAVNVASTARLLEWARATGVRRFVYASSGGADRVIGSEPVNFYLAGKLAGEVLARSYASVMAVSVLRPFFVYGPGQRRSMLLPRLVDAVRTGRPITLTTTQGIRITPTHVADASAAFAAAALDDRGGVFDVAGPEVLTLREIGELIGGRLGTPPRFEISGATADDVIGDPSAMTARLAAPARRLADGIEDVL